MSTSNTQRVVLITGASHGIGRAVAIETARRGMHPVAIARNQGALESLDDEIKAEKGTITLITSDITDREMMERLPIAIGERFGRLDGFVANAAVLGELTPVPDIQMKDWDQALAINITAYVQLLTLLDPLLKASADPRVVGLTTAAATGTYPFWGIYAVTKAAFHKLFETYAVEMQDSSMLVNLVNPGATRTSMREKAMPGEDPMTLPSPEEVAVLIADLLMPEETRHGELINFRNWKGLA